MDVELRARHDALIAEFSCTSTELRVVKTPPRSPYPRTIEAFCTDSRAAQFGNRLPAFGEFCTSCTYLSPREDPTEDTEEPLERAEAASADA